MSKDFAMSKDAWTILTVEDISLRVYYTLSKASPGMRDPGGNMIDPPAEASVDIEGIYLESKESDLYDLLSFDISDLEEKLLEHLESEED